MALRAVRLRNLFLLMAIFASIVAAGCWENRRNMQRVLDDGYGTIVEITGAQYQRLAPLAIEGWRPRFVEQSLSVNLKWDGKDGKRHEYKNVPVTDGFAQTIVSGDQIRLAILPAKVLDDELAVPVINADAAARFASLQDWTRYSAYVAIAAWLGFAATTIWLARGKREAGPGVVSTRQLGGEVPVRRTLFGITGLLVGAILTFQAWSVQDVASEAGGIETTAEITAASTLSSGGHVVQLSWKDPQGGVHHFGPVRVSEGFWNRVTRNGELAVHQTRIRYRGEGADATPVIVDDRPAMSWQSKIALGSGLILMAIGAGSLLSAARFARRRR